MAPQPDATAAPLPSWNTGATKDAILGYINEVTDPNGAHFIPVAGRIATFDNDGTLWSEKPVYSQFYFAMDRVKSMASEHPEWTSKQPYKAILENDMPTLIKQGKKGLLKIVAATHAGMTTDVFEKTVADWLSSAEHPIKKKPYTALVFQPMLELLAYLRAHDFNIFIVSGGGSAFMRVWAEAAYGVPRHQVIGSSAETHYEEQDGKPTLERLAKLHFFDEKEGKPVAIHRHIGRRPVFTAGNSDGDLQMSRWAEANPLKSMQLFVHHTDAEREWAYDRKSRVGCFDKALDEAREKGWTVVDMKRDWRVIYR